VLDHPQDYLFVAAFDTCRAAFDGDDGLLGQMHDRLEEVVIEPHFVIQQVEKAGLLDGVEAIVAQVSTYQG
jgi:hypothetical protein